MATGYEPLNTLKPVAAGIWIIDGPEVARYGIPLPTRATVVRLENGDLWVHAPTGLSTELTQELNVLGPVRHLVLGNQNQVSGLADWIKAYPQAQVWSPTGLDKSGVQGVALSEDGTEAAWEGQIDQRFMRGSSTHKEVVFFHRESATLLLSDLIVALETEYLPAVRRPLAWLSGIDDSDGKMPPRVAWSFRNKDAFAEDLEAMIHWRPRRIILCHGKCYSRNAVAELERAFRRVLRVRQWDSAIKDMKDRAQSDR